MKPVVACTVAACAVLVIAQAGAARASEYACFAMPETIRVGAEGFRGSIEITSSPGCIPAFSVSSTADWVLPAIPGPTVMPLTVEPNTSGRERSAAIVFDGVAVATVVQEAMRELRGTPARGDVAGPLPMGASLDARRGIFRWQPGAEVAGEFAFVFVQRDCDNIERRLPVLLVVEKGP